jgi:PAS domain S-box-containing protein
MNILLLVKDTFADAPLLRAMFNEQAAHTITITHVQCLREAEQALATHAVDVIVLDLELPDAERLGAIRQARAIAPHVPLVVLSNVDDAALAAQALQEGAQDYLIKGRIDTRGLLQALRYAVERKIMETALFAEKERAQVTLNSIGDAVACTDKKGMITFFNRVAEELTGWPLHEAVGRSLAEVFQVLETTSRESTPMPVAKAVIQNEIVHLPPNCTLVLRDGSEISSADSVAPIHDREGQVDGTVIVFRDVSAQRAMSLQMRHLAQHDVLTGLPNRMLLHDRMSHAIALAARRLNKVAVLFLDNLA